jgi:hypothetical protein
MGSLACSVILHLWMAGVATSLVWKYWDGFQVAEAEPALLPPDDGNDGGSGGSLLPQKPKTRMAALAIERAQKGIASQLPSSYSLSTHRALQNNGFEPAFLPDFQGSGWNGGRGSGFLRGIGEDGLGSGCGIGYIANFCCVNSRRPPPAITGKPLANAVIVVDLSGSVRGQADSRATIERELDENLSRLTPGTPFNVVCFARQAVPFSESSLPATDETISAAIDFVQTLCQEPGPVMRGDDHPSLRNAGSSRLDAGLLASFEHKPGEIVIISDGGAIVREGNRSLTQREILERIRNAIPADRPPPIIHTISTRPDGSSLLRKLAEEYEGQHHQPST